MSWYEYSPKPSWTTQCVSYWGAPSGATYKVVRSGMFWMCYRYASKWHKIGERDTKMEAQKVCEDHEL